MSLNLEEFGLTPGESRVYLALLKLDSSTVGPITKEAKISYSKIYEVLQRLIQKGLITYTVKNKTRIFKSLSPNRLKDFLEKEEEIIQTKKKRFQEILPKLKKQNQEHSDVTEIFLGIQGIKTAYERFCENLTDKDEVYFYYKFNPETNIKIDKIYHEIFEKIEKIGNTWKGLATKEYKHSSIIKHPPKFMKFKITDFTLPITADFSEDKVLQIIWDKQPTAIIINSKETALNYRKSFEELWNLSKN